MLPRRARPASLPLTLGSAGVLVWKERRARREHLEDERRKHDLRVEPEAPKLCALERVDQAKLQWKNNKPWPYAASLFFHSRAIDDYHGVVAQGSLCQGVRCCCVARAPLPCISSWKRWPSCMQRKACTLSVSRRRRKVGARPPRRGRGTEALCARAC